MESDFKMKRRYPEVQEGHEVAKRVSDRLKVELGFLWFANDYCWFKLTQYKLDKITGLNSETEREAKIFNTQERSSGRVYSEILCIKDELYNGELEYFVTSGRCHTDERKKDRSNVIKFWRNP